MSILRLNNKPLLRDLVPASGFIRNLGGGGGGDPYAGFDVLKLDFEDGLVDLSPVGQTVTAMDAGTAVFANTDIQGANCLRVLNNTSGLNITTVDDTWDVGDQDWSVEMWLFRFGNGVNDYLWDTGFSKQKFYTPTDDPNRCAYYHISTGGSLSGPFYGQYIAYRRWTHYAQCKDGATIYCYIDGELDRSHSTGSNLVTGASQVIQILNSGATGTVGFTENAYCDLVRVTIGASRYPGGTSFTPPTSFD